MVAEALPQRVRYAGTDDSLVSRGAAGGDRMVRGSIAALACVLALASALPVWAQGGGASSTGTIQGRVSDAQGAVLPGVTVTASSPSIP